jgi:hypothetical protein
MPSDILTAKLYVRRQWSDIFKILKEGKYEPYVINSAKLTFGYKDCRQTAINKQEFRKYCSQEPLLSQLPESENDWRNTERGPGGER